MTSSDVVSALWDDRQLAEYLRLPERTPAQWRYRSRGPRWLKVGRHVRYRKSDVDAWLEQQAQGGAA
ncbi:MAG: helix-turn-helix domain-containing protein [Ilumatobacteraceae bacterium]